MSPASDDETNGPGGTPLFGGLAAARSARSPLAAPASLLVHALALVALFAFSSRFTQRELPVQDVFRTILYAPPPPPALPLPKGDGSGLKTQRSPVVVTQAPPEFEAPREVPAEQPVVEAPTAEASAEESAGSVTGSDEGTNEGMEGGRKGGQVGGLPWGVEGGVVGGTGTVPVANPDQQPRLLERIAPVYPHEAFVKRIQGTVVVAIVIDERGSVAHTKVLEGHPALIDAALAALSQWRFAPAVKNGRPVASRATAPVRFQIL